MFIPPKCKECSGTLMRKGIVDPTLICLDCKKEFGMFEIMEAVK